MATKTPAKKTAPDKQLTAAAKQTPAKPSAKEASKPATVKPLKATPVKTATSTPKPAVTKTAKKPVPAKDGEKKPAVAVTKAPTAKTTNKPAAKAPAAKAAPTTVSPTPAIASKAKTQTATAQKWDEIRSLLLQMKTVTLQEIARSIKKGSEASVGEEPTGDIYDQASSERDRELGLLLNDREREKLHNIDDALLRMDDGEYGICEECDEDIPMGRLKAMPFTRHCVKCKSDLEKLQAQTRRFEEDRSYREMPVGDDDEA